MKITTSVMTSDSERLLTRSKARMIYTIEESSVDTFDVSRITQVTMQGKCYRLIEKLVHDDQKTGGSSH